MGQTRWTAGWLMVGGVLASTALVVLAFFIRHRSPARSIDHGTEEAEKEFDHAAAETRKKIHATKTDAAYRQEIDRIVREAKHRIEQIAEELKEKLDLIPALQDSDYRNV